MILDLLKEFIPKKLEIFKLHNLAKRKYEILDMEFYQEEVFNEQLDEFLDKLKDIAPNATIIEF